jgi:hypothetical protein
VHHPVLWWLLLSNRGYMRFLYLLVFTFFGAILFVLAIVACDETSHDLPTKIAPVSVTPTITPTATPLILQGMVEQANAVAEVEVVSSHEGQTVLQIRRWLKKLTFMGEEGTHELNVPNLLISGSEQDLQLLSPGKRYIVFMAVPWTVPPNVECIKFTGIMQLAEGAQGIFEIAGNQIGRADLAAYDGKPLSLLEADILAALPGGGVPITPAPDTGPADLVRFVQSADMIAEVDLVDRDAGAGMYLKGYEVLRWLKKPDNITGDYIETLFGACRSVLTARWNGHFILFFNGTTSHVKETEHREFSWLTGGDQGAYIVSDDGSYISWAGISHYNGWSVERFEAEIQNALSIPGTPDPKLRPPDTGTPQP